MGNVCVGSSCTCNGCARLRCSNCNCCVGLRSCIGPRKPIRSICPLWRRHKGGTREVKAETKVAITNADPPYVQRKPPEPEKIIKECPRPSRPTSPVEEIRKPVASPPTKDRTKEVAIIPVVAAPKAPAEKAWEVAITPMMVVPTAPKERTWEDAITPMMVPTAPKERTREDTVTPIVSPIATTSPNTTTNFVEPTHTKPAQNTRSRPPGEANKQGTPGRTKKPHNVKRRASAGLQVRSVLHTKTGNLKEYYTLGEKLGQGQFGITFHCVEKGTGKEYACKSIAKRKLITKEDVEDVKREIQIMHHISGHPNVIKIKGAYEDAVAVHVVMELCKGGELFDRIVERGHYTEKKAAELSRVIIGVVQACHSLGVMHRDLKPENFLFANKEEDSPLKTIDFGLSIFFKPGDSFSDVVGSPYYVAPEVLLKKYGMEADVWSAGVIIYILLCGVPPFWAEAEQDIFKEVLHGELDFSADPWPTISESAKDLISKMLVRNPKKRITAHEVLCHPWIKVDGVAPDKPLDSAVLVRLKKFCAMNKLKKMALRIIAEKLSEDEIAGLKEIFKMIDTDNSGQITFEELKVGLQRFGANLDDTEMYSLMRAADVDNSGTIDYGEFIAATLHLNKVEREDCLFAAFSFFDKDGSGYITPDELQKACEEFGIKDSRLEEMIQEVDQDNDGRIDYNEFVTMMQNGNSEAGKKEDQAG